jgi:integrase
MAARSLTSRFVESLKPTPGKQTAYPDADVRGLELRVTSEGRKVWSLRYRTQAGLQKRLTLGTMPSMDLAGARTAAKTELGKVAAGDDPAALKKAAAARAKAEPIKTFEDLAEAYFKACGRGEWKPRGKRKRPQTIKYERGIYGRHLKPPLGDLRLEDIDRATIKTALRKMVDAKIGAQTNRTQALARQCFAFAIAEERLSINPATGFAPLASQKPRTRTLTDAELKALWVGLLEPAKLKDEEGGAITLGRPMAIILQLAMLLLQRRTEVAGMRSSELDLDRAVWLIPAERMKAGLPHLVPLPPRAVVLIREADELAKAREDARRKAGEPTERKNDRPIFPGAKSLGASIRGDSVTHALAEVMAALKIKGASTHDLRRTGSSILTSERLGISPFIRSKVLGHKADAGGGAAVSMVHYDTNEYVAEKRRALEAWEGLLLQIVGECPIPANVTPMRKTY